jgi:putative transposase
VVSKFKIKPITTQKGNSCVFNINYHIVFCPKFRKKALKKEIKEDLKTIFESIAYSNNWKIIELNILEDHIHIFVSAHPKNSPMEIVKKLKGISARLIFFKYPDFKKKEIWGKHLWSGGYYVGTAGVVSSEAIQKYIKANSSKV